MSSQPYPLHTNPSQFLKTYLTHRASASLSLERKKRCWHLFPQTPCISKDKINKTNPQRKCRQVKQRYDFSDVYICICDNMYVYDIIADTFQIILRMFLSFQTFLSSSSYKVIECCQFLLPELDVGKEKEKQRKRKEEARRKRRKCCL